MGFASTCRLAGLGFVVMIPLASAHTTATGEQASPVGKTPAYEVASVRENTNPMPRWNMYFTPDGVHAMDVTLLYALQEAYGIYDDERWSGGPTWIKQRRFDIEAKFDGARYPKPTLEERRAMLQQLLADRFKVAAHREPKEFPLYALVVGKDGPKIAETKPEELHESPVYGAMCTITRGGRGFVEMHGCTTAQLADALTGSGRNDLGRRVVDQTGLTGRYTVALQWTPLDATNAAAGAPSPPDASGPSIFTAVKEQLGLELRPIKGPIDTMVIDRAELPTAN
jgi:uncharacterized protein (TIGR03435 family)